MVSPGKLGNHEVSRMFDSIKVYMKQLEHMGRTSNRYIKNRPDFKNEAIIKSGINKIYIRKQNLCTTHGLKINNT